MNYERINALELLLKENIEALNTGMETGKVTHPNLGSRLSTGVSKYYAYIENINDIQKRILKLKE